MNASIDSKKQSAGKLSLPSVSTDELLRGSNALIIIHAGSQYCLQVTRSHKLILTK